MADLTRQTEIQMADGFSTGINPSTSTRKTDFRAGVPPEALRAQGGGRLTAWSVQQRPSLSRGTLHAVHSGSSLAMLWPCCGVNLSQASPGSQEGRTFLRPSVAAQGPGRGGGGAPMSYASCSRQGVLGSVCLPSGKQEEPACEARSAKKHHRHE